MLAPRQVHQGAPCCCCSAESEPAQPHTQFQTALQADILSYLSGSYADLLFPTEDLPLHEVQLPAGKMSVSIQVDEDMLREPLNPQDAGQRNRMPLDINDMLALMPCE